MKNAAGHCIALILTLAACTNSVSPIDIQYRSTGTNSCSGQPSITFTICQLDYKLSEVNNELLSPINSSDWFNIPLILSAAGAGALLLFDGTQEGLSGIGLGAATIGALNNYLSPSQAREVLRNGSTGYMCLVEYGRLAETYAKEVYPVSTENSAAKGRREARNALIIALAELDTELRKTSPEFSDLERAKLALQQGRAAIGLYNTQLVAAQSADARLRFAAQTLGIALLAQADRNDVDIQALIRSITEQARSIAEFEIEKEELEQAPADAPALDAKTGDNKVTNVLIEMSNLIDGLVNIEVIVAGFDQCAASAAAGGSPTAPVIQTIAVPKA